MGTCTSSIKRRYKQHQQLHKRTELKNSIVLNNQQFTVIQDQRPHSLLTNFEIQSSPPIDPNSQQADTNSLIQVYFPPHKNNWMSSSSNSHTLPRIPLPKSRLPVHQTQSTSAGFIRPKHVLTTDTTGNAIHAKNDCIPIPSILIDKTCSALCSLSERREKKKAQ